MMIVYFEALWRRNEWRSRTSVPFLLQSFWQKRNDSGQIIDQIKKRPDDKMSIGKHYSEPQNIGGDNNCQTQWVDLIWFSRLENEWYECVFPFRNASCLDYRRWKTIWITKDSFSENASLFCNHDRSWRLLSFQKMNLWLFQRALGLPWYRSGSGLCLAVSEGSQTLGFQVVSLRAWSRSLTA